MSNIVDIRIGVLERIEGLCKAAVRMREGIELIDSAGQEIADMWEGFPPTYQEKSAGCEAVAVLAEREVRRLHDDIHAAVVQFTNLFVRDVIGEILTNSTEPVVELTGNSYMPPIRSFEEVERLYNVDQADVWELFGDNFEAQCNDRNFMIGCPDYDNALYGVDLNKWRYIGDSDDDQNAWLDNDSYETIALERG